MPSGRFSESLPANPIALPLPRVPAIVLLWSNRKLTLGALARARASRPAARQAITVNVRPDETKTRQDDGDRPDIVVSLTVADSPLGEITGSVVDDVESATGGGRRHIIMVDIPAYVVGRWYQDLLRNQRALPLKSALFLILAVMVTGVPRQMPSGQGVPEPFESPGVGSVRCRT
jgi:hypothetical protein